MKTEREQVIAIEAIDAELLSKQAERIAHLEGLVALQADALKDYCEYAQMSGTGGIPVFTYQNSAHRAVMATAETVAKYHAEQQAKLNEESNSLIGQQEIAIKSLRREVAMLCSKIAIIADNCPHTEYDSDCTGTGNADDAYDHGADMARSTVGGQLRELLDADLHATAQTYEQEAEQRGAVKALEEAAEGWDAQVNHSASTIRTSLRRMASDSRKGSVR